MKRPSSAPLTGLGVALLLVLAPSCSTPAAEPAAAPRAVDDGRLMPPEPLGQNVWYMRQPPRIWSAVIGNVGIVEQSDGVVLIDSGGSIPDGRDIVAAVAKLTTKPIKAVAISHWHNDHPLGIPAIRAAFPNVRIIATAHTARMMRDIMGRNTAVGHNDPALDRARIESSTARAAEYRANAKDASLSPDERKEFAIEAGFVEARLKRQIGNYVVLPTETFTDRLVIDDPLAPVELHFLGRANTGGDSVAWLPRQSVLFTGDAVVAPSPYGFNSSIESWIPVLERIKAFDFAYLVPGHGAVQRDRTYLDTMIWSLGDVRRQVEVSARAGNSAEQAWAGFDQTTQIARFGATTPWALRWLRGYWLEPLVSSAYRENRDGQVAEGS